MFVCVLLINSIEPKREILPNQLKFGRLGQGLSDENGKSDNMGEHRISFDNNSFNM